MAIEDPKFTERALEQDALRVLEKEAAGFGHTALPKDKFLKKLLRLKDDTENGLQKDLDGL